MGYSYCLLVAFLEHELEHNYFCHGNSQSVYHGNGYDNVHLFSLGGIDLVRCYCCYLLLYMTFYCQYTHTHTHNTLL